MPSLQQRIEEGLGLYPTSRVGDEETPGLVVTAGHIFSLILTQTYPFPSPPPAVPSVRWRLCHRRRRQDDPRRLEGVFSRRRPKS